MARLNKRRPLTGTERTVLSLLAAGETAQEIAHRVGKTTYAVVAAKDRALGALGARNLPNAVYIALLTHQIPPEPCGTMAAYRWHLRRGDHPCADCRARNALERARQRAALITRRNGLPTT